LPRLRIAPQFIDIFFSPFGACVDLEGTAKSNIVHLVISLTSDLVNLEIADLVNQSAPPGMIIDYIQAAATAGDVSPNWPGKTHSALTPTRRTTRWFSSGR
jgi:hypothetical protein